MINITSISGSFFKTDSDDNYYYVVGPSGMVIFDRQLESEVAYLPASNGYVDVWTEEGLPFVYLATSGDGLHRLVKSEFLGDVSSDSGKYLGYPDISSDVVLAVRGIDDQKIMIGTSSGVDYIKEAAIYSSLDLKPVTSVVPVTGDNLYYSGPFGVAKLQGPVNSSWSQEDLLFILDLGTVPALTSLPVNDLDVELTGEEITIAIATVSGITVIREKSEQLIRSSSVLQIFKQ